MLRRSSFFMDIFPTIRFHRDGKIIDKEGKLIRCYNDVPKVFSYLKERSIRIALTSLTADIQEAYDLIEIFAWNEYVAFIEMTEHI